MHLVLLFDQGFQNEAFIDKHVVPSAVRFTHQPERRLVHTINDPITRDTFVRIRNSREGRKQVRYMSDILGTRVCLDNTRPSHICIDANATFQVLGLSTSVNPV